MIGGDTTAGALTLTVQVFGTLPTDQALCRHGAKPGDAVYVSGNPGDAAAALAVMAGEWHGGVQYKEYLLTRFYQPSPRLQLGQQLLGVASSALDVSDGLLADAGHLCEQSGVGIVLDYRSLPLSTALQSLPDDGQALTWALSGGDDYELLFTVPAQNIARIPPGCTHIGEVTRGSGVSCEHPTPATGYQHFAETASAIPVQHRQGGAGRVSGSSEHGVSGVAAEAGGESRGTREQGVLPFASWTQFLAFGFGSGLSPRAPGTAGTLLAIPLYLLICEMGLSQYTLLLVLSTALGIWLCGQASRELGVHDHPGIVWDEFVGYWITMWALPTHWVWVLSGFLVFRFFDILKPWPISLCDNRVHGGIGIMLDDILAGILSCALLHGVLLLTHS